MESQSVDASNGQRARGSGWKEGGGGTTLPSLRMSSEMTLEVEAAGEAEGRTLASTEAIRLFLLLHLLQHHRDFELSLVETAPTKES